MADGRQADRPVATAAKEMVCVYILAPGGVIVVPLCALSVVVGRHMTRPSTR